MTEFSKLSDKQKDYRMYAAIGAIDSLTRDFEQIYAALFAVFCLGFSLYFLIFQPLERTMTELKCRFYSGYINGLVTGISLVALCWMASKYF